MVQRQVIKNLPIDAQLILHLPPLSSEPFRTRNFFPANKPTVRFWATLRRKEGTHETSISYSQKCAFIQFDRIFARRYGQPSHIQN